MKETLHEKRERLQRAKQKTEEKWNAILAWVEGERTSADEEAIDAKGVCNAAQSIDSCGYCSEYRCDDRFVPGRYFRCPAGSCGQRSTACGSIVGEFEDVYEAQMNGEFEDWEFLDKVAAICKRVLEISDGFTVDDVGEWME